MMHDVIVIRVLIFRQERILGSWNAYKYKYTGIFLVNIYSLG